MYLLRTNMNTHERLTEIWDLWGLVISIISKVVRIICTSLFCQFLTVSIIETGVSIIQEK